MPHRGERKGQATPKGNAKNAEGPIVCALCGRRIKDGSDANAVIYSICPSCKQLPHRNPGSTASFG